MTLTKAELIQTVVDRVGLNRREAAELVDAFFEEICAALVAGSSVKLSGFGGFEVRQKPARPGRNPKTREEVLISARRVVSFHPSQKLRVKVSRAKWAPHATPDEDEDASVAHRHNQAAA